MKFSYLFLIIAFAFTFAANAQETKEPTLIHNLDVTVNPAKNELKVLDEIVVSSEMLNNLLVFSLNSDFTPVSKTPGYKFIKKETNIPSVDVGIDRDMGGGSSHVMLTKWEVELPESFFGETKFFVEYEGTLKSAIEQSSDDYQRGFSETPGIISGEGVYLAGSTYWVPYFGDGLVVFDLTVNLPKGWKSVSQGERTEEKNISDRHVDKWHVTEPQEEVFLIAAPFTEYDSDMSGTKAMAFLRTPDETLANKYLKATAQYKKMYEQLLGKYPYTKFALVENFWETGYGMPSFTLLGEKIIRFPFILHSSYPHELLHNWWGNSVYVDFEKGNWCEGLTAYLADHMMKEQRGQGENYRRSTLQKYSDLVNSANDFSLVKFHSRYDGRSEAIGYGKALMMWHMLRQKLGNKAFIEGLQKFYKDNKFKRASYDDLRKAFEAVSGVNLWQFFHQWTQRVGAPYLVLNNVSRRKLADSHIISFDLAQKQASRPFRMDIPVVIITEEGTIRKVVSMSDKSDSYRMVLSSKPVKLFIDPQYDVFRILDANEVPPALTKAYGDGEKLIVLPQNAGAEEKKIYQNFANQWTKNNKQKYKVVFDASLKDLPVDKTVWVLGATNKFKKDFDNTLKTYQSAISAESVTLEQKNIKTGGKDVIITIQNPKAPAQVLVYLSIGDEKAVEGLVRKLPHYGKYSYLAFEGEEPTNIAKGQWPVLNSPLVYNLEPGSEKLLPALNERIPLASTGSVFSADKLMAHVDYLASEDLKGRGLGTPELEEAAEYIAKAFKAAGLQPGAADDTYFQTWTTTVEGAKQKEFHLKNVIGIIPGTDEQLSKKPLIISAHYDHLGTGWPDVHKGDAGKIHFGADDNASGVAILIELAKVLAGSIKPLRTIIFVAFTGEEEGLVGSRYFVKEYDKYTVKKSIANLNIDTDGRLFDKKIMILNGNSAKEWKFVFLGTDYVTGIPTDLIQKQLDSSDQGAFIEMGIPAVQFFTGAHLDYHRPTDTPDKIDPKGMAKVAEVVKEVAAYLADRKKPLTFTGKMKDGTVATSTEAPKANRRASTGTMPDFSYIGEGVKIGELSPDSPAAKAGLQKGDIIVKFDGKEIKTLREYSNALKAKKPGDKVSITVSRFGREKTVRVTLGER